MLIDPFSVMREDDDFDPEDVQVSMERADAATFWGFLVAALLAQAGLFALSLGLMFGGFRGEWGIGVPLVAGGLVALGLTVAIVVWHGRR
ncbi:DUF7322 domain-containing protein [Halorientalis halophila]|uniref:DUF7322 domain-containing protein n=1 Tax=Halorientalis halophila TaxID=3108499 RepID=UPI00300A697A